MEAVKKQEQLFRQIIQNDLKKNNKLWEVHNATSKYTSEKQIE